MKNRRCQQIRCAFFVNSGCKSCENCNAKPFIINPNCQKCIFCEGKENELRFGDKSKQTQEEITQIDGNEMIKEIMKSLIMKKIDIIEKQVIEQENRQENEQKIRK